MSAHGPTGADRAQSRLFAPDGSREPEAVTVLSYGGGQDSTALAMKLALDEEFRERQAPERLICVISDTGNEHRETYAYVHEVFAPFCEEHGMDFRFLEAGGEWHSEAWPSLEEFYSRGDRIGSKSYPKSCTDQLKLGVFYRWLEHELARSYGLPEGRKRAFYEYRRITGRKVRVLIGITAEEARRRLRKDELLPKWMEENVERAYPLVELGWSREDCQDYIRSIGEPVPVPSLCRFCPYKNAAQVLLMSLEDPEGYSRWVELERRKLEAHKERFPHLPAEKNHGVFGPDSTLEDVAARERARRLEENPTRSEQELLEALRSERMRGHGVASTY